MKNDLQKQNLRGRVKSIREIEYEAVEKFSEIEKGDISEDPYENTLILFNEQGNEIEKNCYNTDGSLEEKWTYQYDAQGNLIERNWYNADGSLYSKWICQYNIQGNKIEENRYNTDGSLEEKWTYQYDVQGNKIEWIWSYATAFSKSIYQYVYDQQGNWIKKVVCIDGEAVSITERTIEYYP